MLRASTAHDHQLDLIGLMLHGKAVEVGKVIKLIDDMEVLLHLEQADDNVKKEQCGEDFDKANDYKMRPGRDSLVENRTPSRHARCCEHPRLMTANWISLD